MQSRFKRPKTNHRGHKVHKGKGNSNSDLPLCPLWWISCLDWCRLLSSSTTLRRSQPSDRFLDGIVCDAIHEPHSQRLVRVNLFGDNKHLQRL
jgi:hypothetical protein